MLAPLPPFPAFIDPPLANISIPAGCAPSQAPVFGSAAYAVCGSQGFPIADYESCPVKLGNGSAAVHGALGGCKGDPPLCLLQIELHRDFYSIVKDLFDTPYSYMFPCLSTLKCAPNIC